MYVIDYGYQVPVENRNFFPEKDALLAIFLSRIAIDQTMCSCIPAAQNLTAPWDLGCWDTMNASGNYKSFD